MTRAGIQIEKCIFLIGCDSNPPSPSRIISVVLVLSHCPEDCNCEYEL